MQFFSSFSWMRRLAPRFAIVGTIFVLMTSLAACSGGTNTSNVSNGPVNLTFWSWINGVDKAVALWNQTHPNIHVKYSNVGSGPVEYDKLFTGIKANNEPDIAQVEFQVMPTFETTGALVDLSPYGAGAFKNQFVPWTWNQDTLGNAIYGIPGDTGPLALYYRADLFAKYHIPVPTTWAQYADDAAKLHAADPNTFMTDFPPKQPGWFTGLEWQTGARLFRVDGQSWKVSINSPQAQQVASYWQDLISRKLIKTEPDFANAWFHDLQSGAVATWITAPWGAGIIELNAPKTSGDWKVAPIPQWQAGQNVDGNWGGSSNVVFKSTQHPKEAAEFAEWLNTNQASMEYQIKGNALYPAYEPLLNSSLLSSPLPFFGNQNIFDLFKQASTQVDDSFQWGPTMEQVYSDTGDNFANAVNGQGTLVDGLNAVQQSTVAYMKKQGFSISQ
jgi:multiple sugar transport system substrate-binding protein